MHARLKTSHAPMLSPTLLLLLAGMANAQAPDINASNADIIIDSPGFADFPTAVAAVGRINNDPFDDILVSLGDANNHQGRVWVYFGPIASTDPDFIISGQGFANFGASIDGGDADGDGDPDFVIGAPLSGISNQGLAYVYSGSDASQLASWTGPFSNGMFGARVSFFADVNGVAGDELLVLSRESNPPLTQVRTIGSPTPLLFEFVGRHTSNAGVVNVQDSIPDIAIGFPDDDTNGTNAGRLQYRQGNTGALIAPVEFGPFGDAGEQLGSPLEYMGDLNGDDFGDVLAGGLGFDNQRGRVRIISGEPPFHPSLRVFEGEAQGDEFGASLAKSPDVNGDGVADVIIGAPKNDPVVFGTTLIDAGRAYIFSGATGALLMTLSGESSGGRFGGVVSSAGDFNGDGVSDIAVAARNSTSPLGGTGRIYIFFSPPMSGVLKSDDPSP